MCALYSKRIYLTRSLLIAATKTVDCSFIKAEHSPQVSSKNNSIEKILVCQTIRRITTCFTKFLLAICWTITSSCTSTVCSALYYLVKALFLKAVRQLRCFFFCFRVLFYTINTHALKNAFQLKNNSKFIWLAMILFSNLIIQALPKIPLLIYLNGFAALITNIFFLKLSKCISMFEMFNFSCLLQWPS